MYEIEMAIEARKNIRQIKKHYQKIIIDTVEKKLTDKPTNLTKNIKILYDLTTPFESEPPIYQLTIGDYRVIYDVDKEEKMVYIRAIRYKPPHKTTEEIL